MSPDQLTKRQQEDLIDLVQRARDPLNDSGWRLLFFSWQRDD